MNASVRNAEHRHPRQHSNVSNSHALWNNERQNNRVAWSSHA